MPIIDAALRLIPETEVLRRVPYTRAWLYALEEEGKFPKRLKLGKRRVAWAEHEIDEWIRQQLLAREVRAAA
jgi:prophage regulatory protein